MVYPKDYEAQIMECLRDYAHHHSSCIRKKTAACLTFATLPIAYAANHLPVGSSAKCTVDECPRMSPNIVRGIWDDSQPICDVIHAEVALIQKCAREGFQMEKGIVYMTYQPCVGCATALAETGIEQVIYLDSYGEDLAKPAMEILEKAGIKVRQYMP